MLSSTLPRPAGISGLTAVLVPAFAGSVLLMAPSAAAQQLGTLPSDSHRAAPPILNFDAHGYGAKSTGPLFTAGPLAPSDLTCTTAPGSVSNNLATATIPGLATFGAIATNASGTTDSAGLQTATSQATVGKVSMLGGLVTADAVTADAKATDDAAGTVTATGNVTLTNLKVAGAAVTAAAPNTTINVLLGTVIVNEQVSTADGKGIAVNAIHVKLLGNLVDTSVGHAAAALVPTGTACPAQ
ncbi:choice-of-anchor P family protein [Kitasatospora sp. NPDC050463]|uniref:choice-of-anchor P family protein n=1 Tax=Kitasatospora sp. NPDC050463 TaxID=3155786 RepID=UPI00340357F5